MSMRDDAERLCEAIRNSPAREELRSLLWGLNVGNRCHFGYHARKQHMQMLGYLMVNQERNRLEADFPQKIPALTEGELRLLAGAHRQIVELNRRCVAPLVATLPYSAVAVNPYNEYQYDEVPDGDAALLDPEAAEQMAGGFQSHPAIAKAVETTPPEFANLFAPNIMQSVWGITESLLRAGPHEIPKELWQIHTTAPEDSKPRRWARHIGALTCVRDSLSNLNQLIYHAVMGDELFVLDDTNIIHMEPHTYHHVGEGLLITFLAPRRLHLMELKDVVRVRCEDAGGRLDLLGRVEAYSTEPSPSFGEGERVDLRVLNDDLHTFRGLSYI